MQGPTETREGPGRTGAVATAFPSATEAGLEMLRAGGNAVDAAVAAAWALAVCEPSASGLGGTTTLLLRHPGGRAVVVSGPSRAPAAVSTKTVRRGQQRAGYRSVAVPSMAATLGHVHARYGRLPTARVMEPAIRLAEEGYAITQLQRRQQKQCLADLLAHPAAANLFLKTGRRPFRVGDIFRQPALAATLRRLAQHGSEDFYRGQIACDIAEDMAAGGGLISLEDLACAAAATETEPLAASYRRCLVLSAPPPAGGPQLLLALKILEQFSAAELAVNPDAWYVTMAEVTRAVFRQRKRLTVPASRLTPAFYEWLFSEDCTRKIADSIRTTPTQPTPRGDREGPGDTTHLSVVDGEGCAVALTQSIQSVYGAKVACDKLGFVYNNYLCTLPRRGQPYQLQGGCAPRSNAAPTLVLAGGSAGAASLLALGSAGSRRITSSLVQVISRVVDGGVGLAQAVEAPRIHATLGGRVHVESPLAAEPLLKRLETRFRKVMVRGAQSFFMGAVHAVERKCDGTFAGAADPRRDGTAETC
jgi:gamma-glutamyltranspeptidase / glutathione hydrolase